MANFNFNKVILGGRLTADPESKMTQTGTPVVTFSIAVNRRGAKDGQQQSDFITCVAWRERADFLSKYFHKGSSICVEGEIQTRSWKDNNGNNRYATEVNVTQIHFVESKSDGAAENAIGNSVNAQAPAYIPDAYKQPTFEDTSSGDDDLPF